MQLSILRFSITGSGISAQQRASWALAEADTPAGPHSSWHSKEEPTAHLLPEEERMGLRVKAWALESDRLAIDLGQVT